MARGTTTDEALDECGLTFGDVAISAAKVFGGASGMTDDIDVEHDGWQAVATVAGAHFQTAEDTEETMSFTQFAQILHKAFARAGDPDQDLPGFDSLTRLLQVAWIAVARHMANVFNMEPAEARRLESHEGAMVDWAKLQIATP